ncbi:MAG TPA: hypothetical protein VJ728_06935 [Candidatus Binataceae bacterium]|nr:hypothetical protein [Candidatus Binataceae bacterium]
MSFEESLKDELNAGARLPSNGPLAVELLDDVFGASGPRSEFSWVATKADKVLGLNCVPNVLAEPVESGLAVSEASGAALIGAEPLESEPAALVALAFVARLPFGPVPLFDGRELSWVDEDELALGTISKMTNSGAALEEAPTAPVCWINDCRSAYKLPLVGIACAVITFSTGTRRRRTRSASPQANERPINKLLF